MTTEIENDIAIPEAPKKSRGRKAAAGGTKNKMPNPAAGLIAALKFISIAQKKVGPVGSQFSHITAGWAAASDGIITAACPIIEDMHVCPNTLQFIEALSKATDELAITQLSPTALSVSSGKLRALVPCVDFAAVPIPAPDPQCAVIDDRVKAALAAVAGIAVEGSPDAARASVLLQAWTAVATNGVCLLEAAHGVDLPPGLLLPRASALAVAKAGKPLAGFGFSPSSATFYFDDGSFIKTQLYADKYPDYLILFDNEQEKAWPLPDDFFKGLHAIEAFSPNGNVFFGNSAISSNERKEDASTYKIEGLPERMGFNIKHLLSVEHAFKLVHFEPQERKVFFFGDGIRGVLMALSLDEQLEQANEENFKAGQDKFYKNDPDFDDDDIPF